jgi:hypothetical protein
MSAESFYKRVLEIEGNNPAFFQDKSISKFYFLSPDRMSGKYLLKFYSDNPLPSDIEDKIKEAYEWHFSRSE